MGQWRRCIRGVAVMLAVLPLLLDLATSAAAQGIYTSSWTGYDISWPQCDSVPPPANAYLFGVVGVTSGHAFRNNPCFASQYAWATGPMAPESVYLNLNEDIGTTSLYGDTGPYGVCHEGEACHALNYGYNAASSAYAYAAQQMPSFVATTWWLDIETENSWSEDDLARNRDVIVGALRLLQMEHGFTVGIYSTESMWHEITGSWQSTLPVWLGGATKEDAKTHCGVGFTGGPVYLVQYPNGDYDGDYVC
jgi:hypothetical protein